MRAPVHRSGGAGSFQAVKEFMKEPGREAAEIKAELDELVRRVERARAKVGKRLSVELSPWVMGLLGKAGQREAVGVGAKLHPART